MAKVWVLDTGTKGTGASVVPLESTQVEPAPPGGELRVPSKPAPRRRKPAEPWRPPRFKVVDVVSGAVLADGADRPATLAALREVRSSVDVRVYVRRSETDRWRLLTLQEQRALWRLRDATLRAPRPPSR
jgi:hypothetical protein